MAKPAKLQSISPRQALYILEKLIDERTVSAADIRRHIAGMWHEMNFMEKRLSELRGATSAARHPIRTVKATIRKHRRPVSPEIAASQRLQGQYLGYMRQIPEGDRKRFQEIAKNKGREAAIEAMRKRLGKE